MSICCFFFASYAENQAEKIDSLTQLIGRQTGRERIETLIELSEIYRKISVEKSKEADSSASALANQEGLDNMKGIILLSMGKTASISGDYDMALSYMNQAVELLEEVKNYKELARTYVNLGLVYKNLSDFDAAIEQFDLASKLARQHQLKDQEAAAAANKAIVFSSLGNYQQALENYQSAMKIYQETQDSLRYAKMLMNTGLVYWKWDKNDLALELQLQAKDVFELKKDFVELGRVYNNIGRMYYQDFQDTTLALEYYQKSLEIREKLGNQLGMVTVLTNIGNIYRDKDQLDKAFENYEKSMKISQFIGHRQGVALASYYMAMAYRQVKQYHESNRLLDTTRSVAKALGLASYEELVNSAKLNNYASLKDFDSFLKEFRIYDDHKNEMRDEIVNLKYELNKTTEEMEVIKREFDLKNKQLAEQQDKVLFCRIFLLITMLTLLMVAYKLYKKNYS